MNNNLLAPDAQIIYFESTDSTMLEARRLTAASAKGVPSGTVVRAGFQTAGRGRITERQWAASPGDGLLFTVIFSADDLSRRMNGGPRTLLPLLCGLAAAEAVEQYVRELSPEAAALNDGLPLVKIKWPNDLLVDGKKICGILCESSGDYVYAGMGINLNQTEFPEGLRRPASSLRFLTNRRPDAERLLETVLKRLGGVLGYSKWREEIERRLYGIHMPVRIKSGLTDERIETAEPVEGILSGIDQSGAVLIESMGKTFSFVSGELAFRD